MLSIAAILHMLFHVTAEGRDKDKNEGQERHDNVSISVLPMISEEAIAMAINFVKLCCEQTAFLAGCGNIQEEIAIVNASMYILLLLSI